MKGSDMAEKKEEQNSELTDALKIVQRHEKKALTEANKILEELRTAAEAAAEKLSALIPPVRTSLTSGPWSAIEQARNTLNGLSSQTRDHAQSLGQTLRQYDES